MTYLFLAVNPLDPVAVAQQVVAAIFGAIANQGMQWYQQIVAWATGQQFIFQTGAGVTFQQPAVLRFWQMNVTVADGILILVVLWIAYNVVLGYYNPLQMMQRAILAAVAAHASLTFVGLFINLNNALCAGVFQVAGTPNTSDLAAFLFPNVHAAFGGPGDAGLVFQTLIEDVMATVVILQMAVRVGLLDIIIVFTPIAAILYISPLTQRAANFIFSAFFVTLFLQLIQVTAITVGAALITSFASTSSIVSFLAGVAVLFLVLKIPRWLGNTVTSAIGDVQSPQQYALAAAQQAAATVITLVRAVL